ncbi:MopE-related protein [Sandaracinus amylolyticus]|uniref:MopE-related protein n=1 Tax=Sandaracinus amylolyticus TaxID=927083 RepID=UPI001F420E06|nr:MopE-related protein [Sandaracinus amylolyticus]UJR79418.1 Tryptophan synthase alpha chain [Sandaracinus amylolyticus]
MHARSCIVALSLVLVACGSSTGVDFPPRRGIDAGMRPTLDAGRVDAAIPPCPACDDGVFCNGAEGCAPDGTCIVAPQPSCDDADECTIDRCDLARDACTHVAEDRDLDGDGFSACAGDCDDRDANVAPDRLEVCDGRDQDCDGSSDEGALSECLDCRPGCRRVPVPGETGWDLEGDTAGVTIDPSGELTLSTSRTETFFAWIANTAFATITRLDTRDGRQAAEYDSVLRDGSNHASPTGEECETERRGGNCPSRTAVDLRGAVYVANRAFFAQGTVTKIAGIESDCIDRNGNGVIDTSRDRDGDGVIERTVPGEFLGQTDECLLWTVDVGGINGVPRAIAVDAAGTVWVGLFNERRAVQLDPDDGRVIRSVDLPRTTIGGFYPYGAAADGRGQVWFVEISTATIVAIDTATGRLARMDTAPGRVAGCTGSYGIAVDADDRVWLAGFTCGAVFRFDQTTRTWSEFPLPDSGVTRGIAADASGRVYVASSHEYYRVLPSGSVEASPPISRVTILDANRGVVQRIWGTTLDPLPGRGTTGVGLDSAGMVWLVNQESATATRVDPRTGLSREFPTGIGPYTYSDFTGYALRTFTAPNGYYRTIVPGCAVGPTEWEHVTWDATVPAGTRLELRARTADDVADLGSATWVGPFIARPTDLVAMPGPVGTGRHLELEIQLFSDGGTRAPSIEDLVVQYNCP